MSDLQNKSNLHKEHRKRMDEKSLKAGLENMPEHEVLEKLLFAVIPRGNTNEIAKELCDRFGGIGNVLRAEVKDLVEINGVGTRVAHFLHELPEILGIVERSLNYGDKRIKTHKDACDYVKTFFYGKLTEEFYVISLNSQKAVIRHNKLASGVTDEVHVYTRNVVQIAMDNKAHYVIIAHNHPGGTTEPSFDDIKCTEEIAKALQILGMKLYDSIIVARGEGTSILDCDACNLTR